MNASNIAKKMRTKGTLIIWHLSGSNSAACSQYLQIEKKLLCPRNFGVHLKRLLSLLQLVFVHFHSSLLHCTAEQNSIIHGWGIVCHQRKGG